MKRHRQVCGSRAWLSALALGSAEVVFWWLLNELGNTTRPPRGWGKSKVIPAWHCKGTESVERDGCNRIPGWGWTLRLLFIVKRDELHPPPPARHPKLCSQRTPQHVPVWPEIAQNGENWGFSGGGGGYQIYVVGVISRSALNHFRWCTCHNMCMGTKYFEMYYPAHRSPELYSQDTSIHVPSLVWKWPQMDKIAVQWVCRENIAPLFTIRTSLWLMLRGERENIRLRSRAVELLASQTHYEPHGVQKDIQSGVVGASKKIGAFALAGTRHSHPHFGLFGGFIVLTGYLYTQCSQKKRKKGCKESEFPLSLALLNAREWHTMIWRRLVASTVKKNGEGAVFVRLRVDV